MDYGAFVRQLMQRKEPSSSDDAFERLAAAGLLHGDVPEAVVAASLDHAYPAFGGKVACFLVLTDKGRCEAVAAYRGDAWGITVKREPVVVEGGTIIPAGPGSRKKPLRLLGGGASALFQVPCWIARELMGMQGEAFYPLVAPADACPPIQGWDAGPWDSLRVIEAAVLRRRERAVHEGKAAGTGRGVDALHELGAMYVGSIDDGQPEETAALLKGLRISEGPVWWVEDYTIFEPGHHTLVIRWMAGKEVRYMTRRLEARGSRLVDLETGMASPALVLLDEDDPSPSPPNVLRTFSHWVDGLLGSSGTPPAPAKASLPYLRGEVLAFYGLSPNHIPTRPCMVQGKPMLPLAQTGTGLPPRLLYSPDLFLNRSRVPEGMHPSTVLVEVTATALGGAMDPALELGLNLDSRPDRGYRLYFSKNGEVLPEVDELKIFTETPMAGKLVEGSLSLCVLRRRPADAQDPSYVTIEFALTGYGEDFTLYCTSRLCDVSLRIMQFEYLADVVPRMHEGLAVPLFSKAVEGTVERLGVPLVKAVGLARGKLEGKGGRVPVLWASREEGKGRYRFAHWSGEGIAVVG